MSGSTRSYEMARRLVDMGHQVEIITSTRNQENNNTNLFTVESGIRIHWIKVDYSNTMHFWSRILSFIKFGIYAFLKAKKIKADLIFASSTPLTISIPGIFAAKSKKIPFFFEVRDLWPEIPIAMGYLNNPILRYIALKLEKFSYKNSKGIVALSEGMKEGIIKVGYPAEKIIVIPNGADLDLFDFKKSEKSNMRTKLGFNENDIIILYPGTFGEVNNLEYIINLAYKFTDTTYLKFLLIGDGKEKEFIINKAKKLNLFQKNIYFFDKISKNEVPNFFAISDIIISTVLPIKELEANSANKFFDALASGTCMVINHGGWQEKELLNYDCGFSLPRNIQEAYLKLMPYIKNKTLLLKMGFNARRLGEEKFSRDNLAIKLSHFFEKFII
jgi:glycosyltransferase involved in cell wall biosynthesis